MLLASDADFAADCLRVFELEQKGIDLDEDEPFDECLTAAAHAIRHGHWPALAHL